MAIKIQYSLRALLVIFLLLSTVSWFAAQAYKSHLRTVETKQILYANRLMCKIVDEEIAQLKGKFPDAKTTLTGGGSLYCEERIGFAVGLNYETLMWMKISFNRVGDNEFELLLADLGGSETADFLKTLAKRFPQDKFRCSFTKEPKPKD